MEENVYQYKRKRSPSPSDDSKRPPKHPLLESISQRFAQNRNEQSKRIDKFIDKREAERVHARYIRQQVGNSPELQRAKPVAEHWAKKNGVKNDPLKLSHSRKRFNRTQGRDGALTNFISGHFRNMAIDEDPNASSEPDLQYSASSHSSRAKRLSGGSSSSTSSSLNNRSASMNSLGSDISIMVASSPQQSNQQRNTTTHHTSTPISHTITSGQAQEPYIISPVVARQSGTSNEVEKILIADDSANDSLILVSEEPSAFSDTGSRSNSSGARPKQNDRSSGNRSNNADTQPPQDVSISRSSNSSGLSNPSSFHEERYHCHVLNCGAVFSSAGSLGHHMNLFKHSPCNPCLKARDCKLSPDPLFFQCPNCDREFPDADECSKHMKAQNHSPYYPPLAVVGYMCAQCLYVFENFQACWHHLEQSGHKDICYPFADDIASHSSERTAASAPVPIIQELVEDLNKKCESVAYRLQCLECSLNMENPAIMRHHRLETNDQHMVSVLCDSNLVDIFAGYLAGYSCNRCHRLFNGSIKNGARHECAKGVMGNIEENNVRSFCEFVKWCALTLIKSLEPKNPILTRNQPVAGTSGDGRNSRGTSGGDSNNSPNPAKNQRTQVRAQSIVEVLSSSDEEENTQEDCIVLSEGNDSVIETSEGATGGTGSKRKKKKKKKKKVNDIEETKRARENCDIPVKRSTASTSLGTSETDRLLHAQDSFHKRSSETNLPSTSRSSSRGQISAASSNSDHQSFRFPLPPQYRPGIMSHGSHMPFFAPIATNSQMQVAMENRAGNMKKPSPPQGPSSSRDRYKTRSPVEEMANEARTSRDRSRSPLENSPISTENLTRMRNIIFLDLDNWRGFFSKLPRALPDKTFVWGFFGGTNEWVEPRRCYVFNRMKENGQFFLNERCGRTKDAADFAIVLNVGKMDERLPSDIAFTILSGDKGFIEVERQMKKSVRKAVVINPHQAEQFSNEMIYTMVTSVTDT